MEFIFSFLFGEKMGNYFGIQSEEGLLEVCVNLLFFFSCFTFFFFFFFTFHFFLYEKDGRTPLFIAVQNGEEQVVETLLEKEKLNVDLATEVIF